MTAFVILLAELRFPVLWVLVSVLWVLVVLVPVLWVLVHWLRSFGMLSILDTHGWHGSRCADRLGSR